MQPATGGRITRLIGFVGTESPLQLVPSLAQEGRGVLAVAEIGRPLGSPLDAQLHKQLLGLFRPIAAGQRCDTRLQLGIAEALGERRPAAEHVAGVVSQDPLAASGGDRGQARHFRSHRTGQEQQPIAHQRLSAELRSFGQVQVEAELFDARGHRSMMAGAEDRGQGQCLRSKIIGGW